MTTCKHDWHNVPFQLREGTCPECNPHQHEPPRSPDLTCISCRHWHWSAGERGYSDMTPGCNWSMTCTHWNMHYHFYGFDVTQDQYRQALERARTCPDFERRESST